MIFNDIVVNKSNQKSFVVFLTVQWFNNKIVTEHFFYLKDKRHIKQDMVWFYINVPSAKKKSTNKVLAQAIRLTSIRYRRNFLEQSTFAFILIVENKRYKCRTKNSQHHWSISVSIAMQSCSLCRCMKFAVTDQI